MLKLFQKRVEWKPVRGSFGPAARSAFRVLGLTASASQREVFDAAASVRLALKLGVRKTFEGDLEWLGAVGRGESEVRDAVGRLSEPAQRARERLFWFHGPAPTRAVSTVAELMRAADALLSGAPDVRGDSGDGAAPVESAAALHDAALLALAGLAYLDPQLREENAWTRALGLWARLCEGEGFWSLLVAADLKGDYEQPVTFGEVAELRAEAPRLVSRLAAARARDAAGRDDMRSCLRAFRVLRGAGLPPRLLEEYVSETAGPVEDALVEKIDSALAWVGINAHGTRDKATLRNYSNQSWRRFCLLQPRLSEFVELAGADSYAVRRVFEHASPTLLLLAENFEAAGRRKEAVYVCQRARALAPPGSEKLQEIEEKLRALGAGAELRERTHGEYAGALRRELAEVRVPPRLFSDDPLGGKTLDAYTSRRADSAGWLTSVLFWLVMVAVGVGLRLWMGPGRPRHTINSLPRMTFTPPPPNLNLNLNYNVRSLNLDLYRAEPPAAVRPREGRRGRRRAAAPDVEMPVTPPTTTQRASPPPPRE